MATKNGNTKYIKHKKDHWDLLQKGTGKVLGKHKSREGAMKQLKAIEYFKHK